MNSPSSDAANSPAESSPADEPSQGGLSSAPTRSERFYASLPLFFVGAVCILIAVLLDATGSVTAFGGSSSVHLQPWVLFVALGITGVSAGTIALFSEDVDSEDLGAEPMEVASRERSRGLAAPVSGPAWDESQIVPESSPSRTIWRPSDVADLLGGEVAEPSAPDVVLRQLDDLEVSLRRKPRPSPPESTSS